MRAKLISNVKFRSRSAEPVSWVNEKLMSRLDLFSSTNRRKLLWIGGKETEDIRKVVDFCGSGVVSRR